PSQARYEGVCALSDISVASLVMMRLAESVVSVHAVWPASKPGFASSCTGGEAVACQLPPASQICLWPFAHWVAPGTHEPPQLPPVQTNGQGFPSCQAPPALQLCGTLPAHW